jgi:hypothetical protein
MYIVTPIVNNKTVFRYCLDIMRNISIRILVEPHTTKVA